LIINWKGCGRKRSWPNSKALSRNLPGGTEENHEKISQDIRSPGSDLNPGPPEYEAGVLTTRPRRSVSTVSNNTHQQNEETRINLVRMVMNGE
jgi:hypothetical protein